MDIAKIFARAQSSKIGLAGICYLIKVTFSEILKTKAGNKLMYHVLYFAIHSQSVAIQDS